MHASKITNTGFMWTALFFLGAGCSASEASIERSATDEQTTQVEVVAAAQHTFEQEIEIPANVLPLRKVAIIPRVPGRLEKVHVRAGDEVEEGQVVAQLERRDFNLAVQQARAGVAAARTGTRLAAIATKSAGTTHRRMKALRETGAITQAEMDKVADGRDMGLAKLDASQAQLQLARVGLAAMQTKLSDTVMRAPFAGVVLQRMLDEGSICSVMPPAPVLVIAEVSTMKVEGSVSERDLLSVKAGMPATVSVDALRGKRLQGTIDVVNPMVDPRTRTTKIQVLLDNAEGQLETGMSARIELDVGERVGIAVPDEVILRGGAAERAAVFVVNQAGTAQRRDVVTGAREAGIVEILEGLEIGEMVVRSGQHGLHDGDQVETSTPARENAE